MIQQKLTRMRQATTSHEAFRRLLNQIAGLMTYEVSRDFPTRETEITTPLETMTGTRLAAPVTLVPILRAGLGMCDGILQLIPEVRVGHLGLFRDEDTLNPVSYYAKFPEDIDSGPVIVVDPMLATGGSAAEAVSRVKALGCDDIRFICLVAAPEGVGRMNDLHPDILVYTASLDRQLDHRGYIMPGLGDAGDRIFGTQ